MRSAVRVAAATAVVVATLAFAVMLLPRGNTPDRFQAPEFQAAQATETKLPQISNVRQILDWLAPQCGRAITGSVPPPNRLLRVASVGDSITAVSYIHVTLPTNYSV